MPCCAFIGGSLAYRPLPGTSCSIAVTPTANVQPPHSLATYRDDVEENRARTVVDALRDRGVDAHMKKAGVYQFATGIVLGEGREAIWDPEGTAGIEAQVMRDGMLVGFVPQLEGSENWDDQQVIDAIVRTDYDKPIARQ